MKTFKVNIGLILLALVVGCASSEIGDKSDVGITDELFIQQVNANIITTDAWINRMPNSGGKFFISGEIKLLPSTKYDFQSLNLSEIKIYDGKNLLFDILPTVQTKELTGEYKVILYAMLRGIEPPPGFNVDKELNAELIFEFGSDKLIYYLSKIKVEQVY